MGKRNRGRKRRARRRLPTPDHEEIREALRKESDRGVVLVGTQMIQNRLEEVLGRLFNKMALINYSFKNKEMLDKLIFDLLSPEAYNAPLARSDPRLMMCQALGLLSVSTCEAIKGVQRIRNHLFAHYTGRVSLSSALVVEAIEEIIDNLDDVDALHFEEHRDNWIKMREHFKARWSFARLSFVALVETLYLTIGGDGYSEIMDRFIPLNTVDPPKQETAEREQKPTSVLPATVHSNTQPARPTQPASKHDRQQQ